MSELDRAPLIRMKIDQEIFQDAVGDGDEIEDATVATEVTSFERVGDAYVLEGAIVFAGQVNRAGREDSAADETVTAQASARPDTLQLHNRLPFVLRVPVRSQPRGLINVASRISSWRLEVITAGWVRVVADLSVLGLSGDHGYHFECGSQEYGDVFFRTPVPPDDGDRTSGQRTAEDEQREPAGRAVAVPDTTLIGDPDGTVEASRADAYDLQLTRGSDDADVRGAVHSRAAERDAGMKAAEALSDARGGAGRDLGADDDQGVADSGVSAGKAENENVRRELADLDKAFGGHTDEPQPSADAALRAQQPAGENVSEGQGRRSKVRTNVVEFDFEHQLHPGKLRDMEASGEDAQQRVDDLDSAVREGDTVSPQDETSVVMRAADEDDEPESAVISSELWSFVDFNAPEQFYTLRFVIASEEENLDSLADRMGIEKSELLRANTVEGDVVHPGQVLAVPAEHLVPPGH